MNIDELEPKTKHKTEVFLDMDGVLADFFSAQAKLAHVPTYRDISPEQNEMTLDKMVGTNFFATLDKFPSADQLVEMCIRIFGHYNICSSPLRGDFENSERNKKIWIAHHLKNNPPLEIYITPNKQQHAKQPDGTPNILIDDRGSNITSWEAAGGVGIKYQADEDGLDVVVRGFKRAFDIINKKIKHEPLKLVSRDRSKGNLIAQPDQEIKENDAEHRDAYTKTGFWGRQAAGCVFLAMDTGRLCLAERSWEVLNPNTWGTWGGAIDEGEDPAAAVRREAREETGYNGPMKLIPLYVFSDPSGFKYYNFLALVREEFKPRLNWESSGYKWFEANDWPSPLHPGVVKLLKDSASVSTIRKYVRLAKERRGDAT